MKKIIGKWCGLILATAVVSSFFSTILLASGGQLWAFGQNYNGQLGDGTTTTRTSPVQVAVGVTAVAAGGDATAGSHAFYLKADGTLWASGLNTYGQLGDGTTLSRVTPVQVASGVSAVSAGVSHSIFLKTDGTVWATGYNLYGQLGDGTTTNRLTPVQVASGVSAIAAGGNHSLFLKTDGTLWAAGYNSFGQLGDGTKPTNQPTPVQMAAGVRAMAAGGSHSIFLKTDDTLWVTGSNASGQLGVGPGSSYLSTPAQLTTGVSAIAAGNQHSLFLKTDGTLWAMGQNLFGQLGDGTMPTVQKFPVQVASRVSALAAGASHSLFLKTDGSLWSMGLNTSGQLGDGTTTNRGTPSQVTDEVLVASGGPEASYFIKAPGMTTQLDAWTALSTGPVNSFHALVYGDGRFAAGTAGISPAGSGGLSLVSEDGLNWTASSAGALTNIDLQALAYGNGLYVAVGANEVGGGGAITTSVDGISWAASTAAPQALRGVVWGNNLFVAVGESGLIMTSPDGSTWTVRGSGTATSLMGVTYGGSRFVAVGGAGSVLSSTDGITWATHVSGSSGTSNNLTSVTYGNGQFVAVGNSIITSSDGTTWTQRMVATSDGTNYFAITYRVGQYVAVGTSSSAQGAILSSSDGIGWTAHNPSVSETLRGVGYGANRFVVVGDNGTLLTSAPVGSVPVVTANPVGQSVYAGTPVSFSVAVIGASPFTYQWRRNNVNISGANSATYSIAAPDTADAGSLIVVVSNAAGNVTSVAATLTVLKANQTISFAALPTRYYGDAPFALTATASPSGLPVTFSVLSGPATISGNTVTPGGVGTVTIRASQSGNISYNAAPNVDRSFTVAKATPVITWAAPAAITYGVALDSAQLSATASVSGSFGYSPASGAVLVAGAQTLTATFTPTDTTNYNVTSAQQTITVNKAAAIVALGSLAALYDGAAKPVSVITTPGSLNVDITYDGSSAAPANVGSYAVVATVNDPNYQGSASGTLAISKGDQTITFDALPTRTLGDAPFNLTATASSLLPVAFSVASGPATIAGNTVTLTGAGTVTIRAAQSGNAYYNAAANVDRSFTVSKPAPVISWATPSAITFGTALSGTQLNATANVPGTFVYSPASGVVPDAGSQVLAVTFTPADPANYYGASAQQTLAVSKAAATVTLGSLDVVYDGSAHVPSATTTPASLGVNFTYNGSVSAPSSAGSYTVVATINDSNYAGAATGTLTITRATPVIGWSPPAAIAYGTALDGTQLNATAGGVGGTFAYGPVTGTVLGIGLQNLTVNFSPADTANYNGATAQQTIIVFPASGAPVIIAQPQSQTVFVGRAVTFTATAIGTPTPTYQWRKEGVNISGATTSSYTIDSGLVGDSGAYSVIASNSAGSDASADAILTVRLSLGNDFNLDGKPDVLLENTVSGQRVLWLMGGPNNAYVTLGLDLGFLDAAWRIVGLADFNGDGGPDILLENSISGQRVLWLMGGPNGRYVILGLDLGYLDPVWHIAGLADFNGDGKPDILLENTVSGQRVLWLMGGPNSQYVTLGVDLGFLDAAWRIVGLADFNQDGKPDILLENTASGQRVLWLMGGANSQYVTLGLDLGFLDPVWHIVGLADFNGDGGPDILLENAVSGQRVLWLMGGPNNVYVTLGLDLGFLDPAWHIVN